MLLQLITGKSLALWPLPIHKLIMQYIFISKYYLAYDRTLLGCINQAYFGLLLRLSQWFFQDAFYFLQWCYLWFHCLKNQSNRVKGILNMCDLYNPKKHLVNNVFPDIHTWWENSSYWFFLVWCWPPTKMGLGAVSLFRKGWFAHQGRCTNPGLFCRHFSLLLEGKKMLLEV